MKNDAFSKEHQTEILEQYVGDIISKEPVIIIENTETLEMIVKKYIDVTEYEQLKNDKYICIKETEGNRIFELKNK